MLAKVVAHSWVGEKKHPTHSSVQHEEVTGTTGFWPRELRGHIPSHLTNDGQGQRVEGLL